MSIRRFYVFPTFIRTITAYASPTKAKIRVVVPPKTVENCARPFRYSPELYLPIEKDLMMSYIFNLNV